MFSASLNNTVTGMFNALNICMKSATLYFLENWFQKSNQEVKLTLELVIVKKIQVKKKNSYPQYDNLSWLFREQKYLERKHKILFILLLKR